MLPHGSQEPRMKLLKRREVIALLGGATAAWPTPGRAQKGALPVIGFLNSTSPDGSTERLRGFRQGLKDTGYVEHENVAIEYRWAENQMERLPALAAELVRRQVAMIARSEEHTSELQSPCNLVCRLLLEKKKKKKNTTIIKKKKKNTKKKKNDKT